MPAAGGSRPARDRQGGRGSPELIVLTGLPKTPLVDAFTYVSLGRPGSGRSRDLGSLYIGVRTRFKVKGPTVGRTRARRRIRGQGRLVDYARLSRSERNSLGYVCSCYPFEPMGICTLCGIQDAA